MKRSEGSGIGSLKKELAMIKVVLDTKPLIKLFAKEEGWEAVQKILAKIEGEEILGAISVVTLTEIYYKYFQEDRPDLARARTEILKQATYLKKLHIDEDVAVKAGEFKGKYRVPIADAFIGASACLEGAILVSDDPDYKRIKEIRSLTESEFISKFF